MNAKSRAKSKWLAPDDRIPEMGLAEVRQLMRNHFAVRTEPLEEKPYWFRFVGAPYNTFLPDCRSLRIMAHNRGTAVSPLCIKRLIEHFEIPEDEFREAYNSFFGSIESEPAQK